MERRNKYNILYTVYPDSDSDSDSESETETEQAGVITDPEPEPEPIVFKSDHERIRHEMKSFMNTDAVASFTNLYGLLLGDSCSRGYGSSIITCNQHIYAWLAQDDGNEQRLKEYFDRPENTNTLYGHTYKVFGKMFIDNGDTYWAAYLGVRGDAPGAAIASGFTGKKLGANGVYPIWRRTYNSDERKDFLQLSLERQYHKVYDLKDKMRNECVMM